MYLATGIPENTRNSSLAVSTIDRHSHAENSSNTGAHFRRFRENSTLFPMRSRRFEWRINKRSSLSARKEKPTSTIRAWISWRTTNFYRASIRVPRGARNSTYLGAICAPQIAEKIFEPFASLRRGRVDSAGGCAL